jgi:DNA-binding transcriptional MerR regulator
MARQRREDPELREPTYPLGAAVRLTGLTPDLLRAWERRYGAVRPLRTDGGTRRYRSADIERLRLLKAAVDAGHRIGDIAGLENSRLGALVATPGPAAPSAALAQTLEALERLDAVGAEREIALQLSALGPVRFGREFAVPLLDAIGERWAEDRLCVAAEHLGSGLLRSLLGTALRPTALSVAAPSIVFTTLPGERHEMGLLVAALVALGAGGNPIYLGPDLPIDEILRAVELADASAVALSLIALPAADTSEGLSSLRSRLAGKIELWVGGARASTLDLPRGADHVASLGDLEHRVAMLNLREGG